jgi:general secretion pathway protein E
MAARRVSVRLQAESVSLRRLVADHLREHGLADPAEMARAELIGQRTGQPVEQVLNQLGSLSDDKLVAAYRAVIGVEIWDPATQPAAIDLDASGLSLDFLRRLRIAPIAEDVQTLVCAACDPLDEEALSGLRFATGRELKLLAARPTDWRRAFDIALAASNAASVATDEGRLEREIDQVSDIAGDGPGARLVAAVFEAAIASNASDIHFEPGRNGLRIRFRVDGRMNEYQLAPIELAAPAVSRVKVIASLDLGEKRLPQDGRTTFVAGGRRVDVRVATSPTVFGESAVLRILDRNSVPLDLDRLGLNAEVAGVLKRAAKLPHGLFLVTGPTGSGKTTTLYALLQTFSNSTKKVLSVEDPVEFHFDHVSQTQVAAQSGLSFARALRSFLRQDPDVILVGEIRDPETAEVAVQAAMTGHLVLASVHANDALAVLPRLMDMGVQPYQLAAAFRGACAQRLVRQLCPACRAPRRPTEAEIKAATAAGADPPQQLMEPVGCSACMQTGFKGRLAIGEGFVAEEELLRGIGDGAPPAAIAEIAERSGLGGMARDGFSKANAGLTTYEEVVTAVHG